MTKFLLTELKRIQEKYNHLPRKELVKLSKQLKIPLTEIYGVATFYSFLSVKPQGKNFIHICNNPSCYVNGSLDLIKFIEKELKIKSGETTKDKKFTLHIGSCIGCCDKAPAMMINRKVYNCLNKKKIKEILSKY